MSRWAWEVRDLSGVTRSIVTPRAATITRNLNRPSTLQLVVDPEANEQELSTTARVIYGFRAPAGGGARVLWAAAKVVQVQAEASVSSLETLTLTAADAMAWLASRYILEHVTYAAETPRDIVADLVDIQTTTRAYIGMVVAAGTGGPPRDRTYEYGKNVAEAIQQLAEVDDGFYYRVDPYDDPDAFSEFVLLYPDAGDDQGAVFSWGAGTESNLAAVGVTLEPPLNSVIALGSGDGDAQLTARERDAASATTYGLYEDVRTFNDVIVQDTLSKHALDALRPNQKRTYSVTVAPQGDAYVPSPWDEFDVGDTVRLNLRGASGALTFEGRALVTSYTVSVDADGVEQLSSLSLQETD